MIIQVINFVFISIISLFIISKGLNSFNSGDDEIIGKLYASLCLFFSLWCFLYISATFSISDFWKHIFYYFSEFLKILSFVSFFENIACLTGYFEKRQQKVYKISTFYLYYGITVLFFDLIFGHKHLIASNVGVYPITKYHIVELLRASFYIVFLFGLFYLVINYREKYKKPRERFASNLLSCIVFVSFISLIIEICGYCFLSKFYPSVIISFSLIVLFLDFCVRYFRSIEYNRNDYAEALAHNNKVSIFICDDEYRIIMENRRLEVMSEKYRDSFSNRSIFDVFKFSDSDIEKYKNYKDKEPLVISGVYQKMDIRVVFIINNKYDRFGFIFSSLVQVYLLDDYEREFGKLKDEEIENNEEEIIENTDESDLVINNDVVKELQLNSLIEMIENGNKLYNDKSTDLFKYNLLGIKKCATKLGYLSLVNLCNSIDDTLSYSGFEGIESLMIELDRQCETLKIMKE